MIKKLIPLVLIGFLFSPALAFADTTTTGTTGSGTTSSTTTTTPTPATSLPTAPTGVVVNTLGESARVSWVSNPADEGVTLYKVFINGSQAGTVTNDTYYSFPTALGSDYSVYVVATNSVGDSPASSVVTYSASTILNPSGVMVTDITNGHVTVSWNPETNTSYNVFVGQSLQASGVGGSSYDLSISGGDYQIGVQAIKNGVPSEIVYVPVHVADFAQYDSVSGYASTIFNYLGSLSPITNVSIGLIVAMVVVMFSIRIFKGLT